MKLKLCPECKESKFLKDFYGKEMCYQCVYQRKLKTIELKKKICNWCGEKVPSHLSKYCCQECARKFKGHNQVHWSRRLGGEKLNMDYLEKMDRRTKERHRINDENSLSGNP